MAEHPQRSQFRIWEVLVLLAVVALAVLAMIPLKSESYGARFETAAAAACRDITDAEEDYHKKIFAKTGVAQYAQSLKDLVETSPGRVDRFKDAEGPPSSHLTPTNGYCYKVLKSQGVHAKGGHKLYNVGGIMSAGYAFVAYPAQYSQSCRDTFIVNQDRTIYEKDLGENTSDIVETMTEFDPDSTWFATQ